MIVVGVDVHRQSLTSVAVDLVGRPLAEQLCFRRRISCGEPAGRCGKNTAWASVLSRDALAVRRTVGLLWG